MKKHLFITLSIVAFLAFFFLGKHPVSSWDEARTGVNAIDMLHNGDWVNLHYAGQPDDWCAKPPFVVWWVAASFSVFGKNEWALRLPSALSIIGAFFFIFKIISLFRSAKFALWTCLVLASVKGLIGWHVGRTGDFDAMLLFFLMGGVYFFLRAYVSNFQKTKPVIISGFFFGLSFFTKGPAGLVLFPGLLLFLIFEKKVWSILRLPKIWAAISVFLLFPIGWGLTQHFFGIRYAENSDGDTAFERLFIYDVWNRFTENEEGWKSAFSPDFFFYSLDKNFNLWNYLFFAFLFFGILYFIKNRSQVYAYFKDEKNKLLLFSLCLYFPLAIFLTLAAKSHRWYLVPAIPFVGIATFWGIDFFWKKYKWVKFIFWSLLAFSLYRQILFFAQPENKPQIIVENKEEIKKAKAIYHTIEIEQDVLLYLYFLNDEIKLGNPTVLNPGELKIKKVKSEYLVEK